MQVQNTIHITLTNEFKPVWQEYQAILYRNESFKKLLMHKISKDRRLRFKDKQSSFMARYGIALCLRLLKKEELEREIKDEETKNRNIQTDGISDGS